MDLLNPPRLDKNAVKFFANRAAKNYDRAAILQEEILNRLLQRLPYMRHRPATVVDVGCGTGSGIRGLQRQYPRARVYAADLALGMLVEAYAKHRRFSRKRLVVADMERLPFVKNCFDLVFSSLSLPWANDLRATLAEYARIARPGALIMFSSFGPGTLHELSQSWRALDGYPHIHPFVDMHDVGDAMLAAGMSQPVVDSETLRVEYRSFRALLDDLRDVGANNADLGRRRGLLTPRQLQRLEQRYRELGFERDRFIASIEVVYGHAWAV